MFKFARYLFVLFIITTIVPLLLLLLFTNNKIEKLEVKSSSHMLELASKQIMESFYKLNSANISNISIKLQGLNGKKISDVELKKLFPDYQVSVDTKVINVVSYNYELVSNPFSPDNKVLNVIYKFPVKSNSNSDYSSVILKQPVNLENMIFRGPFESEFYYGEGTQKKDLISIVKNEPIDRLHEKMESHTMLRSTLDIHPASPREMEPWGHEPSLRKYDRKKAPITRLTLNNSDGSVGFTVLIRSMIPPKPMGPPGADWFNALILVAGVVLSVSVAFIVHRTFVIPLSELTVAAKEIKKGNLKFILKTDSKEPQIVETFSSFNNMIKGLLEKENLRDSYIASLTHDLRTPIIAQQRALSLITQKFESMGLEDERELSKSLERNSTHLLRIVNLILEGYQFSRQTIKLKYVDIDLQALISDCFEKVLPISEDKNISLINSISSDFIHIEADKISLERIFLNLIYNAVENIDSNKTIKITAIDTDATVTLTVEDNGNGIAPAEIGHIFDMYYSGKSVDRKIGSGLGLDVCKKLVDLHKGIIFVESEVGVFTKFTVILPKKNSEKNL
ncbi:MAG: HAMP domain-containing sensor histidine kinase [Candidatus Gastranaerophilales bacterium]|nr:HAMP domain-containing sensor histidine kinase [Candidatus Gastranaerophilales bacterium]